MNLHDLLKKIDIPFAVVRQGDGREINKIAYDSRKIEADDLFVAMNGIKADGMAYIQHALENGAAAVATERMPENIPAHIMVIVTPDTRAFLSALSSVWWGSPDKSLHLIGVTGTNGKTTTTKLIKWLWESNGTKSGLIGTINNMAGGKVLPATHTTPESWELFEILSMMQEESCKNVVMEVSSHALKQGRVADCHYDAAVFTNLTQDHLDYHGSFNDYLESKLKLFRMIKAEQGRYKYAVVNMDDALASRFIEACSVELWTYGVNPESRIVIKNYSIKVDGTYFTIGYDGTDYDIYTPLTGKFNIYNTLNAVCVGLAEGMSMESIIECMKHSPQVAGRFERVDEGQDYTVIVDYAHTPDGLINVLSTARELNPKRIITVFGCGGDRDKTKRPIMGGISAQYSNFSIITSDNPRTESPDAIIAQIEEGMKAHNGKYTVQSNRREAIETAISMAGTGDIVLVAGKGHEDYQLINGQVLHFDDKEVVREAVIKRGI